MDDAAKQGHDVRISSADGDHFAADNLRYNGDETSATAQNIYKMKQQRDGDRYKFPVSTQYCRL